METLFSFIHLGQLEGVLEQRMEMDCEGAYSLSLLEALTAWLWIINLINFAF